MTSLLTAAVWWALLALTAAFWGGVVGYMIGATQ